MTPVFYGNIHYKHSSLWVLSQFEKELSFFYDKKMPPTDAIGGMNDLIL
jgi:hypothetical protein